jgi:signal transduction histidine kinase
MTARAAKTRIVRKWRPSIGLIVTALVMTALALPLAGLFFFRIFENQLIHQTESELIGQSVVLAIVMRREIEAGFSSAVPLGAEAPPPPAAEPYEPIMPTLDLTRDALLGRRPESQPPSAPADPAFTALGARLAPDLAATQRLTLAGFRLLDPNGVVIAGREEVGRSLANIEEVAEALRGRFRSVMRLRVSKHEPPPLYSLSRGTGVRIFTATPVIVRGRVAGVVYASRTPSNVFKSFYEERSKVAAAGFTILGFALLIGLVFHRTITQPINELRRRTAAIGRGDRIALRSPAHYGTAEFAQLSQSFLDMAEALQNRSDFIATFAAHVSHELKSPLTAIQGAAELLRDDLEAQERKMSSADRRKFLDHIVADTGRLTAIVRRLRELAQAEGAASGGVTTLAAVVADIGIAFPALRIQSAGDLAVPIRMSFENARVVLAHLADNAANHGAKTLTVSACLQGETVCVIVQDDGSGVSRANRAKIFDSFFTTRRESGGTGMGLAIVRAMLEAHGGSIELAASGADQSRGAVFVVVIPAAENNARAA